MVKSITSITICLLLLVVYSCFAQQEGYTESDDIDEAGLNAIIGELVEKVKSDDIETRNSATEKLIRMMRDLIGVVSTEAKKDDLETKKNLMKILEAISKSSRAQLFLLKMDADSKAKIEELSKSMPDIYDRIGDSSWESRQKLVVELRAYSEILKR